MNDSKFDESSSSHDKSNNNNNNNNHQDHDGRGGPRFIEIRQPINENDRPPRTIKAYAIEIEPKECSKIVKKLSKELPLPKELEHLKRVRKPILNNNNNNGSNTTNTPTDTNTTTEQRLENDDGSDSNNDKKKKKPRLLLQVLIGRYHQETLDDASKMGLGPFHEVVVPGRPPESYEEQKEHYKVWPTNYYPLKTEQHKEQELAITDPTELQFMQKTIESSIETQSIFVVDPTKFTIVSRSDEEAKMQQYPNKQNPLATPILFALQGVSRLERQAATNISVSAFSKGQYLCTGYDLYTYYEPTIFEAMSCVHSRLRRLIFFVDDVRDADGGDAEQQQQQQEGKEDVDEQSNHTSTIDNGKKISSNIAATNATTVWTKGCTRHYIHCLPGTNHKFRAFQYVRNDDHQPSSQ